jgi:NAD(P)-dependent dehydrogenase (short-subunit alcohol dehydrogenase family)
MTDWRNKNVLVCGATGALGSACALALADAGATVVLAAKSLKPLEKRFDLILAGGGPEPALYPINFEGASGQDYLELAARLQESLGGIDALLWAVGHWHGMEAINTLEPQTWIRAMHLNCSAPFLLFQALHAQLRARAGVALFALQPKALTELAFAGAYGTAQAGLRNWVTSAASENERLLPRVIGVELPPLKSKLRLAAFPAESVDNVRDPALIAPALLTIMSTGAPGIHRID